jgi:hypothetical protein
LGGKAGEGGKEREGGEGGGGRKRWEWWGGLVVSKRLGGGLNENYSHYSFFYSVKHFSVKRVFTEEGKRECPTLGTETCS